MSTPRHLTGLTASQVEQSRLKHGANLLTPPKRESSWHRLLAKFRDPLIVILLIAGVLAVGISFYQYYGLHKEWTCFFEPIGIFVAIILATGLAFIFEEQAEKEFSLLNRVNDEEPVKVMRDGNVTTVPRRDVVVGDIVLINTGDEVPADGNLVEAVNLTMDESTLTGEPSCRKTTDPEHFDTEVAYPSNRVLRGTKVMEGNGVMEVDLVGDATENGKVFTEAQIDRSVKTPLNEQLEKLAKWISIASYVIGGLIIVGRMIQYFIQLGDGPLVFGDVLTYFLQTLMVAVTLIVVSVPEGLPMAVTLSLAYSMRQMLKTNNLVRKMHACETMGAATVICTDKTGTLTQNRMTVVDDYILTPDFEALARAIAINTTAEIDHSEVKPKAVGNPTEGALLMWLESKGYDYHRLREEAEIISQTPFSTELKYMLTTARPYRGAEPMTYVKGAPEIVLGMCDITSAEAGAVKDRLLDYQNRAMRTLAFAVRPADGTDSVTGLTMQGLVAIADPVRTDVPAAIEECRNAGIDIKIVTGDTPATATAIARSIGLLPQDSKPGDGIITGPDFEALSDEQVLERCQGIKIIARARPMDKKRLVEALQKRGEVVAVTGDGTNDAPALKAAHVGLSMGDGTSVAKEASDITIIDNSFASIARAVMWGRSLYRNIQRFILFQLTVNVVACLTVLAGAFIGTDSPLTVTQMLWVNLIMDTFAAMALASLPPSRKVMEDKPRDRRASIIDRHMLWTILGTAVPMFLVLVWLLNTLEHYDVKSLLQIFSGHDWHKASLQPYELSLFFTIFVMMQFWNLFNAKAYASGRSTFHFAHCRGFLWITAIIFFGQILIVSIGGPLFNVVPLSLQDWLTIIISTSFILWIGEVLRLFR